MSVIDFELTLNRFSFKKVAKNKIQIGFIRISWWKVPNKHSISFEVNWRTKDV